MLVGYARISTNDQTLDLQHDALTKAGCSKIFTDTASGAQAERKGLTEAISYVRAGDTLVVWKLDRLGRSLKDLITRITELNDRKIGFKVSVRPRTCSAAAVNHRGFASLEPPSGAPEGGTCGGSAVDYAGCEAVAEVIRHGISASIRLMGCPSAILVRMSLR
jgi:Resolvase, N terminal domain